MAYYEVLVFFQEGCPACTAIEPIVKQIAEHYAGCGVQTRFVDVWREGVFADTMKVDQTPTVIGCRDFRPAVRMVGAGEAEQRIAQLYGELVGDACPVWRGDV
jgi:thioredoxin-like negative regulator of GroEL